MKSDQDRSIRWNFNPRLRVVRRARASRSCVALVRRARVYTRRMAREARQSGKRPAFFEDLPTPSRAPKSAKVYIEKHNTPNGSCVVELNAYDKMNAQQERLRDPNAPLIGTLGRGKRKASPTMNAKEREIEIFNVSRSAERDRNRGGRPRDRGGIDLLANLNAPFSDGLCRPFVQHPGRGLGKCSALGYECQRAIFSHLYSN